jgi:hypothetical protein
MEEKHTCRGSMEASWEELVAYTVGWQWYCAAYWREFRGAREKQNEREREREREIKTICARLDLAPKRNKKQIKRERLRFESERRRGGEQFSRAVKYVREQ